MHQPKEIYSKNLFFSFFVCVLALIIFLSPNFYSANTQYNAGALPNYNSSPTGQPAASFSTTTTLTEKAETLTKATATVKVINSTTQNITSFGSGVAIADEGYLVTNYHVISSLALNQAAYSITLDMTINNTFTEDVPAKLLWYNAGLDVAILKSQQTFDVYANMTNRWIDSVNPLKVAEEIWTLGTPYETELFGTFSKGTISSSSPRVGLTQVENSYYVHNYLIHHDAPISNGSSGGGLFDMNGNLVGLNTCGKVSSSNKDANGLYFAVPIYPVMLAVNNVISGDKNNSPYTTPLLGVQGYDKDFEQNFGSDYALEINGMYLTNVTETSDAYAQGLRKDDVIVGVGNYDCLNKNDSSYFAVDRCYDLSYALLHYKSSDTVSLFYENQNGSHRILVKLG